MKKGFTLVETLVAVFILTLGIVATSTVTQRNLQSAYYSRDQITAYFLAEEMVEVLRNMRDTNVLRGTGWLNDMSAPQCDTDGVCGVPVDVCIETAVGLPHFVTCPAGNKLKYHATAGYGFTSGNESKYARETTLTRRSEDEVEIKVTITWSNTLSTNKSFTIYKSIFKR